MSSIDIADIKMQAWFKSLSNVEQAEVLLDAQGLDELDRGESVDLEDVLEEARTIVSAARPTTNF
ncbi:hypothetical protein AB4Z52_13595 [Rhizobium sp. 2YAF20]|uniref:hypothetical protein n=1 Tax=Rhizobium sp. 2YAF20 TaxID=3233027 RepID=UPI003F9A10DE